MYRFFFASAQVVVALLFVSARALAESSPFSIEGFGEASLVRYNPGETYEDGTGGVAAGLGSTAWWSAFPVLSFGAGARLGSHVYDPSWGTYYALGVPLVVRLNLPVYRRGQQFELGAGAGPGYTWMALGSERDPTIEYKPNGPNWVLEAFLGYQFSRYSNGLAIVLQAGAAWRPRMGGQTIWILNPLFLRLGVSYR